MLKKSFQHFSGCFLSLVSIASYLLFLLLTLVASSKPELSVFLPSLQLTIICCSKRQGVKDCELLENKKFQERRKHENTIFIQLEKRGMLSKGMKQTKKYSGNFNIILIGTILIGISLETFNLC